MSLNPKPPKVHSAFNPIMFIVAGLPDTERSELIINVDNREIVLSRQCVPDISDIKMAYFDISGVIKTLFSHAPCPTITPEGVADNRLFVKYTVNEEEYIAINAVAHIGMSTDWSNKKYLYYTDTHKVYQDYARDITILNITDESASVIRTLIVPEPTDGDYLLDGLTISPQCAPLNPFYVRWLNRLGGIDYYMFSRDQEVKTTAKSAQNIALYNTDTLAAKGSSRAYAITADRTVTVGAEGISDLEYKILSEIPTSPIIEWFNEELAGWQTITVNKADNTHSSRLAQQSFEVVFDLPDLNLQFA